MLQGSFVQAGEIGFSGAAVSDDVIHNMRGRIAKCRRLAATVMDDLASKALLDMASEIERDMRDLEAESNGRRDRA
jgi:hypothetical protein